MPSSSMRNVCWIFVLTVVVGLAACESPKADGEGAESASATPVESDGEQVESDLPGVESVPVDVAEDIDEALVAKKKKEDPTYRTHHKTDDGQPKFTNRLILESSPYLRQHAHNPVNWFPWGDAAFEKAEREGKPVLLSVGYSTCHWCHVMERKSFEDLEIAEYLNENYVAVKVDRERRPDVDDAYMEAVRMLSRSGGWPMTVWLTADRMPFMGGTYFPPDRFSSLLKQMKRQYDENPGEVVSKAQNIAKKIHNRRTKAGAGGSFPDAPRAFERTYQFADRRFDDQHGGLKGGKKFPRASRIRFLLRYHKRSGQDRAREMAVETLDNMAEGGIYDDVGGGFHRYTTDAKWLVPHFEKMLYDNAQLTTAYTEGWQATGDIRYARIVEETLTYLMRDMSSDDGAFYAATDADSPTEEGHKEEGAFFVWSPAEIDAALNDEQAEVVKSYYDITKSGNFEGKNILHTPESRDRVAEELGMSREVFDETLERARKKLYYARDRRPHPHRDENIIAGWNGLAVEAFAKAALVFDNERWLERARENGSFILEKMRRDDGTLVHNVTFGEFGESAYASDYAFVIAGLLALYEASEEPRWLEAAAELQDDMLDGYWDDENAGFFQTSDDAEEVIGRKKPDRDGTTPSANSYAALNLLKLYQFTLDKKYQKRAEEVFEAFGSALERRGAAMTHMLVGLDFLDAKPREIAMIRPDGTTTNPLMNVYRKAFLPNAILVGLEEDQVASRAEIVPWLEDKKTKEGKSTAYVCRNFTCKYPTNDPETFAEQISDVTPLGGE